MTAAFEQRENYKVNRPLFAITQDVLAAEAALDEVDDGGDELDEVLQWINAIVAEQAEKVDGYCWLIKRLQAEADSAKAVATEFAQKKQQREAKIDRLKKLLQEHMKATGQTSLIGNAFRVAIQRNGGKAPLNCYDPSQITDEFYRVEKHLDNDAIRRCLESGVEVPGVELGERGEGLRIR